MMFVHMKIRDVKGDDTLFEEYLEIPETGDRFSDILNSLGTAQSNLLFDNEWTERYGGDDR